MKKIYSSEVLPLFKKKGVREECECCGHKDWILMNNFAAIALQTSDNPGLSTFPIIALECTNCGNMRFFRRSVLGVNEEAETE